MADILKDTVTIYKHLLREDYKAQDFLKNREVSGNTALFFELGATGPKGEYYKLIKKEFGYSDDMLELNGLMKFNGEPLEYFYNAVIIPVRDYRGRIVNITSRKYDGNPKKYINLPNTPLEDFFGLEMLENRFSYNKWKELGEFVVLAEGQFDTIVLQQNGFPAMGILGVNNIREPMFNHLQFFDSVVLCFDMDGPGIKATKKVASYIKYFYPNMKIYKADLGEHNDANDFFLAGNRSNNFKQSIVEMKDIEPKSLKQKNRRRATTRSNDIVQTIKDIRVEDFLISVIPGVQWEKTNSMLKTACPFSDHKDTVASFSVYTKTNSYYCWGCGRGGDLINFCGEFFDTSFKDSVDILKKWSNQ